MDALTGLDHLDYTYIVEADINNKQLAHYGGSPVFTKSVNCKMFISHMCIFFMCLKSNFLMSKMCLYIFCNIKLFCIMLLNAEILFNQKKQKK